MYNGIINVYKEKGFTSHDVVAKLRGILHQKKIGHTGTLDPDAEGVLPVCLGSGTKLCDMLTDKDKTYEAVLLLGVETDTQDISGTIIARNEVAVTMEQTVAAISSFVGEYMQVPPMYSALKVDGKKLYELAREGKTVERKARPVTIYDIEILEIDLPRITMRVSCSKGTYIRTLCDDIGRKLGCGGCMEKLLRTKVSQFELKDSLKLSQIEEIIKSESNGELLNNHIVSVEEVFSELTELRMAREFDKLVLNGNPFLKEHVENDISINGTDGEVVAEQTEFRVYTSSGIFIGIYAYTQVKKRFSPVKIFYLNQG